MPYFKLGNLKNYIWNKQNLNVFKKCVKRVLESIICAAKTYNFIHRDLHCENIMLKARKTGELKTYIIDFKL